MADADTIKNYERVMRNIRYVHNKAEELYMRKFVISCSSQSARFVSNEFEVLVSLIHHYTINMEDLLELINKSSPMFPPVKSLFVSYI